MPDDGNDASGGTDPLFRVDSPIFTRKELLEIEHIPNEERILGRDEQIKKVANALNPAIAGGSPRNMIVYGKTVYLLEEPATVRQAIQRDPVFDRMSGN